MGAIHGCSNLSTTSRTLSMSFGFVKQHPPTKKGFKKHDPFFFTSLEARLECSLNPPKNKIELLSLKVGWKKTNLKKLL